MNHFQAYLALLNDTILHSLIFVPGSAYVGDVMVLLGGYNLYLILMFSLIGSVIGSSVNWIIGFFLRKIKFSKTEDKIFSRAEKFFQNKGRWILLLSAVPLWGCLFTTAAGIARFSYFHFLIMVTFSHFIGLSLTIFF